VPLFEYACTSCHKQFTALVGVLASAKPPACPRCGGVELTKLVSRFARVRSEDDALDALADEAEYGDIENDPKAMRKWVRDMGKAMDEDLDEDFDEAMEEEMTGKGSGGNADDGTIY
jgi:putative FmdB family regulatory protein